MSPTRCAGTFLIAFLGAVFALQWWQQPQYPLWMWTSLGGLGVIAVAGALASHRKTWLLLPIACTGVALAVWAVAHTTHVPGPSTADWYADGAWTTIEGVIADEPDRRATLTKYTIGATLLLTGSGRTVPISGNVLITDKRNFPRYEYGDVVRVSGTLERPGKIQNFDYARYLSLSDVYSLMNQAKITPMGRQDAAPLQALLFGLKHRLEAQINRIFPEPHASFLDGLLTGARSNMPQHLQDDFKTVGLTHIVAISGTNITIIVSIISLLLFWLPLRWRFAPSVVLIICFTIFVGAGPSVVRASIMGILGLLALQLGRQADMRLIILWTAFFMLLWNPKQLWGDAGFQLSFLAVIGIVELPEHLLGFTKWMRIPEPLEEPVNTLIAAQMTSVPWSAYLFGQLSLVSPIANIVSAPFVPLAMLLGFVGVCVSFAWFWLGQVISYFGWAALEAMLQSTMLLAKIPFALLPVSLTADVVLGYYLLLMSWLVRCHRLSATLAQEEPP